MHVGMKRLFIVKLCSYNTVVHLISYKLRERYDIIEAKDDSLYKGL